MVLQRNARAGRLSLQRGRNTNYQCTNNITRLLLTYENTRQRTTKHTHPSTKPSTYQPTHHPCATAIQQYVQQQNRCVGSYSNVSRVRRYSVKNQMLSCSDTEGFPKRRGGLFLPGLPSLSRSTRLPAPANQRSVSGIGVSTPCGARRCRPRRTRFSSPGFRRCRYLEGCLNRGWENILPGLSTLYTSQSNSDRPLGLGFPHRAGRCRPGRTRFSSPGCQSCRDMEACLNRGWVPILPGCDGTERGLPRGSTPAARALPPDWPRAGGAGTIGQWDWGSKNAGMKAICLLHYIVWLRQRGGVTKDM